PETEQVPPVAAQSSGARATPAASQRCSRLPLQVAVLGVQAAAPTWPGWVTGRLGSTPSGLTGGQPTAPGVHAAPLPPAPGSALPVPPTPDELLPASPWKLGTSSPLPPSSELPQPTPAAV